MSPAIAIVGISADLPSGKYSEKNFDHGTFFEFLLASGQSYENIPENRLNFASWMGNGLGHLHVDRGSFLKDIDLFDHVEFGISSRDARAMAPGSRKLLEQCFLALLDSGIDYRRKLIGCYTSSNSVELATAAATQDQYEPRGSFAGAPAMVANRISTHLDLVGPSIPVDTACSSSQTAFHLAVQALMSGDCEAALVGGCQINHRMIDWIAYSQSGVLSMDGKCKPFDASADGFGRAEGCVAVVLKPLEDALRDNDRIYATVLGTSSNSTGSGGPPGAPVAEAQIDAMTSAFARAGKKPSDVAYVEVHATGTAKGDPTEANWIGEHFQHADGVLIGSVKGNIGHTEITSFLASLSKVLSIFEHKVIPPNVNLVTPNPAIRWHEYNLRAPTSTTRLPSMETRTTLISMSSSGIGGSNGHVVLEAPPEPRLKPHDNITGNPVLLIAAGLSPRSASTIADHISAIPPSEHAIASTVLGRRAKQMNWRSYAVVAPGTKSINFSKPQYSGRDVNPLVFVFSGQGPQYDTMGQELFAKSAIFRDSILEMDVVFQHTTGKSIVKDYGLFNPVATSLSLPVIWPIALTLPAITMFQIALFDLLVHLGVHPDIVLGHSAGETAVLYASGAAPKAMAVELAIIRGRVFSTVENLGGTMAALSCSPNDACNLLVQYRSFDAHGVVELACLNSPTAVAISGHEHHIDDVLDLAHQAGIFAKKIRTRVPIHSSMMDACRDQYLSEMYTLFQRYPGTHTPKLTTYSTLTGDLVVCPFDGEYYWSQTRSQVLFAPVIETLDRQATFIEISPHPVLSSYISEVASDSATVLPTVWRPKPGQTSAEYRDLLHCLGKLTAAGHNCVDFTLLTGVHCSESKLKLPAYPFVRKQFPLYPDTIRDTEYYNGPLNRFGFRLNRDTHPTFAEHIIRGEPIWPAAGFLEMALEFGATALFNVNLHSLLPLSTDHPLPVKVVCDGAYWRITSSIHLRSGNKEDMHTERLHADGYMSFQDPPHHSDLNISKIRGRCHTHVGADMFYSSISDFSSFGRKFQRVTNIYYNSKEALGSILGLNAGFGREKLYILHPAILDACFQIAAYRPFHGNFAPNTYYLPARIEELILHQPPRAAYLPAHIYAHVELRVWEPDRLQFEATISDDFGKRLCTLKFEVARHQMALVPEISVPVHIVTQPIFCGKRNTKSSMANVTRLSFKAPGSHHPACEVSPRSPILDAALLNCCRLVRNTVSFLTADRRQQVIRICVDTHMGSFVVLLVKELRLQFPDVAFELALPEQCTLRENICDPFMIVRREADVMNSTKLFDIVACLRRISTEHGCSPLSLTSSLNRILLPGGTVVLTDLCAFETVDLPHAQSLDECRAVFRDLGYTILHSDSHSTFDAQRPIWHRCGTDLPALFVEETAFIFEYKLGNEAQLQWDLSGFNSSQELDLWILATEGSDAAAGSGLVRALRRELLFWNIRFLAFPTTFSEEMRRTAIKSLPACMKDELDVIFSANGDPMVPRLAPLVSDNSHHPRYLSPTLDIGAGEAVVSVQAASAYPEFTAFVGTVTHTGQDHAVYRPGSLAVGLQAHAVMGCTTVKLASITVVPPATPFSLSNVHLIPGILISILACLGPNNPSNQNISVLVTHCDTVIGSTVCNILSLEGIEVSRVNATISLLQLARLRRASFNLVISGYEDKTYSQVLRTLLLPSTGILFPWKHTLPGVIRESPSSIGNALHVAITRGYHLVQLPGPDEPPSSFVGNDLLLSRETSPPASFHSQKVYVILGGLGSIGAHLALDMFQRGARHIVVASRLGQDRLLMTEENNLIVRRIFSYLQSVKSLDLRLEAVDATCLRSMQHLFESVHKPIGGCIIVTAALADALFPTLTQQDFDDVFASKTGVVNTLRQATDTSIMDFVIAFSSMTSVFGTGGQTNYCAANAALEEQMRQFPNGFAFVCPGISDSSLMRSRGSRVTQLADWSITMEEMLRWFHDAMHRHQNGDRIYQYIPALDWLAMDKAHKVPRLGEHLVATSSSQDIPEVSSPSDSLVVKARQIIQNVLQISDHDFDPDVPLTSYGMDSLSAGRLSFSLRSIMEVTQLQLLGDNSLSDITRKLTDAQSNTSGSGPTTGRITDKGVRENHELMEDFFHKFSRRTDELAIAPLEDCHTSSKRVVLLTGSTGALGCHILSHLLTQHDVQHVYALNRPGSDGPTPLVDRQAIAFEQQGLPPLAQSRKLTLIVAELEKEAFGVSSETLAELLSCVTHIIHNAWRVDFGARLPEFESLLIGTEHLLHFAMSADVSSRPSVSFVSTIGVARNVSENLGYLPEAPIEDPRTAVHTGYSESKWIAERLVQYSSKRKYLKASIIRVGLLTGSTNGVWDTRHWVPALVQSGAYIGCIPDGESVVSWLPINDAAAAIVDMGDSMNETLHLVHPQPTTWRAMMDPIAAILGVPLVPYNEWFARLKATADFPSETPEAIPAALRMLDFFQDGMHPRPNRESIGLLPKVASHKGVQASQRLRNGSVPVLCAAQAESWIRYWREIGFIPRRTV